MPSSRRIIMTVVICLALSVFGNMAAAPAQEPSSDRDLFDFPDAIDLYCVYHPSSSQAIVLVPADGVASMVFALTAFDYITLASLTGQDWATPDLLKVFYLYDHQCQRRNFDRDRHSQCQ